MHNVLEVLKLSTDYLDKKGVESPRLNAELLLTKVLNCNRIDLYLLYDKPLTNDELDYYRNLLARRGKREPLQYIIGYVEFFGCRINVDSSVLIPRPETEILVELIIKEYQNRKDLVFLDVGVGSGNIAIALIKNIPGIKATGIDNSESALNVAKKNAIHNNVLSSLSLNKYDILKDNLNDLNKYDFIVSNPPYVSDEDFKNLEPELKNYEPSAALTDFNDGLTFYRKIISISKNILKVKGKLFLELGIGQHQNVKSEMLANNFINIKIEKDLSGIERIIYGELE